MKKLKLTVRKIRSDGTVLMVHEGDPKQDYATAVLNYRPAADEKFKPGEQYVIKIEKSK